MVIPKETAIITGSSQGIGAAIARRLSSDGFSIGRKGRHKENMNAHETGAPLAIAAAFPPGAKIGHATEGSVNNTSSPLKAFKRATSLGLSRWYMGNLTTYLAEAEDTNGAFCLVEATLAAGNEPPPHAHSREDELFYVLEGEFDVYVGEEAFKVKTGECIFLPRFKPHAWVIRSPRLRVLTLLAPAGLEEAFRSMSSPAQSLELPTGALTYSKADFKQTAQRFSKYGARLLAPDEVAEQLPLYPKSLPPNPSK